MKSLETQSADPHAKCSVELVYNRNNNGELISVNVTERRSFFDTTGENLLVDDFNEFTNSNPMLTTDGRLLEANIDIYKSLIKAGMSEEAEVFKTDAIDRLAKTKGFDQAKINKALKV